MRANYASDSRGLLTKINVDYKTNKVEIFNHCENPLFNIKENLYAFIENNMYV